jgi:phosphatidylglycerol:prolipoprotein diacylglycerol transferase
LGINLLLPDYITMLVLACLAGTYLCVKAAEKEGIPTHKSLNTLLIAFISAVVGARLYYVGQYYGFFISHPFETLALWKGGFASYGGFIAGTVGAVFYLKGARIPFWKFADCCAPSIALGVFLTRIGCFLTGCCFGKVSDLPWAVRFPRGSGPYVAQLLKGEIAATEVLSLPVHPTQIYHALTGFVLFFLLINFRRHKTADGQLCLGLAVSYSMARFFIEFFRGDAIRGIVGAFSLPQIFSIILAVVAGFFLYLTMRAARSPSYVPPVEETPYKEPSRP